MTRDAWLKLSLVTNVALVGVLVAAVFSHRSNSVALPVNVSTTSLNSASPSPKDNAVKGNSRLLDPTRPWQEQLDLLKTAGIR